MAAAGEPLNLAIPAAGTWGEFMLTHTGSLVGGLELSGLDPQGKGPADYEMITRLLRNILQNLHPDICVTQYYWHYTVANRVMLRERNHPRSRVLTEGRQALLDSRSMSNARLFWLIEIPSTDAVNRPLSIAFIRALFEAPFSARARGQLRAKLTERGAWIVEERELTRQVELLNKEIADLSAKLEILSPERTSLSRVRLWALCRAVVNLNPAYLDTATTEAVPVDDWDRMLADGDWGPVTLDELPVLKLQAARPTYARVASIIRYGEDTVPEGAWARERLRPVGQRGNYLVVTRFTPMSRLKVGTMISGKESELYRSQMKIGAALTGKVGESEIERKVNASSIMKKMVEELEEAAHSADRYGYYNAHVVIFGDDAAGLRQTSSALDTAMSQSGLRVVWESAALLDVFTMLLPGYGKLSFRRIEFTSSQVAAASLVYRPHIGAPTWGTNDEEAVFVFESDDGSPFYFTPYIGQKCLTLGVGPTRAGKTFTKNLLAAHMMKFQGLYHSIGVDNGDEPLAAFFGDDAGVFRIANGGEGRGFKPFVAARPDAQGRDTQFANHMLTQLRMMLELNDSAALREMDAHEQRMLDEAIQAVLQPEFDPSMRTLGMLLRHCEKPLQLKFSRWMRDGHYGHLFDNQEDGVGALDKRFAVYNLGAVKDIPALAKLAMNEILFRVIRVFEDPQYRQIPKFLEIDEAQYVLSVPGVAETVIAKARTWFKHGGGMGLWTQNPEHYMKLGEWETLRSSATTFFFMADQEMNREIYRTGFNLTDGELDAIEKLTPRKQAFIVQRELGVSKVVNIESTPEEYALITSHPDEAPIVQEMLRTYSNVDEAVHHAVERLALLRRRKEHAR